MPNEFSVRLVPAKMAGVVSPRGGGGGLGAGILLLRMEYFFFQRYKLGS